MKLFLDTETYSVVPIAHGTHAYAEKAEVMIITWAADKGPVHIIDLTRGDSLHDLYTAICSAEEFWWANGNMFDYTVIKHAMPHLLAKMPVEKWRDVMVQALCHSMPGALGKLCDALGVSSDNAKDKEGKALIHFFCKPTKDGGRNTRKTHPDKWEKFCDYAKQDIVAMREVHRLLPKWNYPKNNTEVFNSILDMHINQRGICVDTDLYAAALSAIKIEKARLAKLTDKITDGDLSSTTKRDAMLVYVAREYGVELPDLKKATVEQALKNDDLPVVLRDLLAIRLEACTSSTAKYATLSRGVSSDGRVRGTMQFRGASRTGRVGHRLLQPGNMPRPDIELMCNELGIEKINDEWGQIYIASGVEALKSGSAPTMFGNIMGLCSNLIRSLIIAPPGKKLCVSDLSSIEGRKVAWLACEQAKLDAYAAYDAGKGPDLYKLAYARAFGVPPEEAKGMRRQIGKVIELACGFGSGVAGIVLFALTYNVDLHAMRDAVMGAETLDHALVEKAEDFWLWSVENKRTAGLERDVFIAVDVLKRAWRATNPNIERFWYASEDAFRAAVSNHGRQFTAGRLVFRMDGKWLRMKLPSGRYVCYPGAQINDDGTVSYMGINQYTKRFERIKTYGGKLVENATQAAACDILFDALPRIEAAGYQTVLTIHDEVLAEAPDASEYSADGLSSVLAAVPTWAPGLPLAAAGFETYRYRKDLS